MYDPLEIWQDDNNNTWREKGAAASEAGEGPREAEERGVICELKPPCGEVEIH